MKPHQNTLAGRVSLLYALVSSAWIVGSDWLLESRAGASAGLTFANIGKGLGFVAVTAALLYAYLRTHLRAEAQSLKRAEESERRYRTIFEGAHDAILLLRNGRFIDCNNRALEVYGRARGKLIGLSPLEFSPEKQPDGRRSSEKDNELRQRALSGEPQFFEWQHQRPDGTNLFTEVSLRQITLESEALLLAIVRDVTRQKETERELHLLNRVYALVGEINQAIVRATNREELFNETCRIAVEHGGFRMAWVGLLDKDSREIRPVASAGDADGFIAGLKFSAESRLSRSDPAGRAVETGEVVVCANIKDQSGVAPWRDAALARNYSSAAALPLKVGGKAMGAISVYASEENVFTPLVTECLIELVTDVSFALDVLERNRQREIEQQRLALQHSALEAAANAIVISDHEGTIEWVNAAFTRFTGYSRHEVIGKKPRVLKSGLHDHNFYRQMWETIRSGNVWQGLLTNKRKDGSLYFEEMTITPVHSKAGDITHFIAIKQDVTERRNLENQFLRAQRVQSMGLLAGGIAHDLNNVLAPVLMALPMLRESASPRERDEIVATLEKGVRRGARIIQQVLTYARGVELQRVPLQIQRSLHEVIRISEETFPRNIQIASDLPGELWEIHGDPTQIHQVLLNLALNARDAMPHGGRLEFRASGVELPAPRQFMDFEIPAGRYVRVSVMDSGSGIPPDVLERMFEPFFTTKPSGRGTGLGLSTVLGIVKSHGGLVEVDTRLGAGSGFHVYFPTSRPGAAADVVDAKPAALPKGRGELVLIADDEPGVLRMGVAILSANGYVAIAAKDGAEALGKFTERSQDIRAIITDVMMPGMDGVALLRAARNLNSSVPAIVTTGLMSAPGEEDRTNELRDLGVRHFLHKPFATEDLLHTLHAALHPA